MTAPIDLESLRYLLWEIDNQVVTHGIGYREVITRTERVVSEVIAELTARRARDAEVEALVAAATPFVALLQAHNEFDHKRNPVSGHQPVLGINDVTIRIGDLRLLRAALLPFAGDKP